MVQASFGSIVMVVSNEPVESAVLVNGKMMIQGQSSSSSSPIPLVGKKLADRE